MRFQARTLLEQLGQFTEHKYPPETINIAKIIWLLAQRVDNNLGSIDQLPPKKLTPGRIHEALQLADLVHTLNAFLEYLQASHPSLTPPGVQHGISRLVSEFVPKILTGTDVKQVVVLVRPQWTYNLTFVDLLAQIDTPANVFALDPEYEQGVTTVKELISHLWQSAPAKEENYPAPEHVAVVSFAGLDRDDVLLYPLLAHEIAHFLDFAYPESIHANSKLDTRAPTFDDVVAVVDSPNGKSIPAPLPPQIGKHLAEVSEKYRVCLREITADLLATRMVGMAYFFALAEFFKTLTMFSGQVVHPTTGYPGIGTRLWLVWSELMTGPDRLVSADALNQVLDEWPTAAGRKTLREYLYWWGSKLALPPILAESSAAPTAEALNRLVAQKVLEAIPDVRSLVREIVPKSCAARLPSGLLDMVRLLSERFPPFQPSTRSTRRSSNYIGSTFGELLTAGWFYQIGTGENLERKRIGAGTQHREYRNTCDLLFKALELRQAVEEIGRITPSSCDGDRVAKPPAAAVKSVGVVSGPALRAALDTPDFSDRLFVYPDYGDEPIEAASWDVHLGTWFRLTDRTAASPIDVSSKESRLEARQHAQKEVFVPFGGRLFLHPGDFALAASLEYVGIPASMMAFVEGKSSLGRCGLLIATATQIAPGFKGCIVLELFNAGTVTIILRPAMRIAQLVFVRTSRLTSDWTYSGDFLAQIKP